MCSKPIDVKLNQRPRKPLRNPKPQPQVPLPLIFQVYAPKSIRNRFAKIQEQYAGTNSSILLYGLVQQEKFITKPQEILSKLLCRTMRQCDDYGSDGAGGAGAIKSCDYELLTISVVGAIVLNSSNQPRILKLLSKHDKNWSILGHLDLGHNNPHVGGIYMYQFTQLKPKIWLTFGLNNAKDFVIIKNAEISTQFRKNLSSNAVIIQYDPWLLIYNYSRLKATVPKILVQSFQVHQRAKEIFQSTVSVGSELIGFIPRVDPETSPTSRTPEFSLLDTSIQWKSSKLLEFAGFATGLKQFSSKVLLIPKIFKPNPSEPHRLISKYNTIGFLIADLIAGFLISLLLQFILWSWDLEEEEVFKTMFQILEKQIEELSEVLLRLLEWLHGAPGGLKLNVELNTLFYRFYSYHLYLWKTYIGLLEPLITTLLTIIVQFGFLGFTIQIGLVKDLLSIASFHTYCLYVYATRLFYVELTILKSLGRVVFLGKKWNPLRKRIDTVHLSLSEMFASSLAFTIAVFLVPTVIVYYVVFLCLRIPSLILESIPTYIISILNSVEIWTFLQVKYYKSSLLATRLEIERRTSGSVRYELVPIIPSIYKFYKVPVVSEAMKGILIKIIDSEVITQ